MSNGIIKTKYQIGPRLRSAAMCCVLCSENSRRWTKTDSVASVCDAVHDITFAPNLGRSYHLLAVATKDVRILMLKPRQ